MKTKPVLVTTEHRGVFFGRVPAEADLSSKVLVLEGARMCLYWSADVNGVFGLAVVGPNKSCRLSDPLTGQLTLQDVTAVAEVSKEAAKQWMAS